MNINNFKNIYPYLMKAGITPYLWGAAGIGKTQVVRQLAEELEYNFIYLTFGAVEDVGDIIGLQEFTRDSAGEAVSVKHVPPNWFPKTTHNIILIDEFNRSPKSVIQAMLPFILEGKLHTHQLPEDTHIILAANPPTDDFIVGDTSDRALQSRACHILLEPSKEEFLQYCLESGTSYDVISFIQENPELLEQTSESYKIDFTKPSRRAYKDFISPFMKLSPPPEIVPEVLKGLIGLEATTRFLQHLKSEKLRIKGVDIMRNYNEELKEKVAKNKYNGLDALNIIGEEIFREVKKNKEFLKKKVIIFAAFY